MSKGKQRDSSFASTHFVSAGARFSLCSPLSTCVNMIHCLYMRHSSAYAPSCPGMWSFSDGSLILFPYTHCSVVIAFEVHRLTAARNLAPSLCARGSVPDAHFLLTGFGNGNTMILTT